MSKLAVNGGTSLRDAKANPWPKWPVWDENEEKGLLEVLRSGVWSYNGPKELEFNKALAEFIGTEYAVSNYTGDVYSSSPVSDYAYRAELKYKTGNNNTVISYQENQPLFYSFGSTEMRNDRRILDFISYFDII